MPLSANDNPVLVAPRPVRLNTLLTRSRMLSAPDHFERVRFSDENSDIEDRRTYDSADKDIPSQRSSPRSPLPTEALEEFLSILRPSFFPPSSPVLLTRRPGAVSLPAFHHERSYSLKGRVLQQKNDMVDELEVSRSTQPSRNTQTPDTLGEVDEFDANTLPVRWFASNVLSSPISRMHTRNPFQRHSSNPVSPGPVSPMALSPAAIPLPLPTADELVEIS